MASAGRSPAWTSLCIALPRLAATSTRHAICSTPPRAGPPPTPGLHLIVGVDEISLGYYQGKLGVEWLVADAGLSFTTLRATQFHDPLVRVFAVRRRLPVLLVPTRTSFQPIDISDVADRLIELALADPAGRVTHLGGPEIRDAGDLADTGQRAADLPRATGTPSTSFSPHRDHAGWLRHSQRWLLRWHNGNWALNVSSPVG